MKKIHRLRGKKDFQRIFRGGERLETPFFSFVGRMQALSYGRFVSIVSKQTARSAVVRNRLRRRAREWIRTNSPLLTKSVDLALVIKKDATGLSRQRFYEELENGTKKILSRLHRASGHRDI